MYNDEYAATAAGAAAKVGLLKKNPLGYFLLSALAGAYIGFGILLSFTVSGTLGAIPMTKIAMGLSFGIALSLVIIAGAELFTGNAFVLYNGWRSKTVTLTDVIRLWVVCYLGNWFGAIVLSLLFYGAAGTAGGVGQALANAAAMKMSLPPLVLFLRGILCNVLVCLAVWCGFRCKSDSGKLIMVFWCLYAFFTCGFEQHDRPDPGPAESRRYGRQRRRLPLQPVHGHLGQHRRCRPLPVHSLRHRSQKKLVASG